MAEERVEINTFDNDSVAKIVRAVRRLQAQYRNLRDKLPGLMRETEGFTIRTGVTTTNAAHPNYPSGGCKFVVQFEDWTFEETVGNCDRESRAWTKKFVVAQSYQGEYIEQDEQVLIVKIPGKKGRRWWILPVASDLTLRRIVRFKLTANLALNTSAAAVVLDCSQVSTGEVITVRDSIGEWHGLTGYEGWAVQLGDCAATTPPTFEILFLEAPARFIEFTLTADMANGSTTATVDRFWGLTPNGITPGGTLTVYDRANLFRRALTGAKGYAVYDERHTDVAPLGRWVVFESQSKAGFICFTLTQDPSQGTATANVNHFWGTQQDVQDPGATTSVYFCTGHYPHALSGARGIAALDSETNRYRVIECDQMAISCTATSGATFCTSDTSVSISAYDEASFFTFGLRPTALSAALNLYGLAGLGGSELWLEYSEVFDDWIVVQVEHVEETVMLDLRFNDCKIEKRTLKVAIMTCESASWSTAIQMYSAQVVEELYKEVTIVDGSGGSTVEGCDLGQRTKNICVFEDQPDITETPIITGVKQTVVVSGVYDGECFVNLTKEVFVLCVGADGEEEVFCASDCIASGSGQ